MFVSSKMSIDHHPNGTSIYFLYARGILELFKESGVTFSKKSFFL